jgi:hypothetical protein
MRAQRRCGILGIGTNHWGGHRVDTQRTSSRSMRHRATMTLLNSYVSSVPEAPNEKFNGFRGDWATVVKNCGHVRR